MNIKTKVKNYDNKIKLFFLAVAFYSILTLSILAFLTLFDIHFIKEMQEIVFIDKICSNNIVNRIFGFVILFLGYYPIFKFSCPNAKLGHILIITLIFDVIKFIMYYTKTIQYLNVIVDTLGILLAVKLLKGSLKKGIVMVAIVVIVQALISAIRNYWLDSILTNHTSLYLILNIDLFIVLYSIMKGDELPCGNQSYYGDSQTSYTQLEDSSLESLKCHTTSLKALLPILRKPKLEEKKLANRNTHQKHKWKLNVYDIIYVILYVLWNIFTFYLIYCMAKSQNKVFEVTLFCIAFVINKSIFGMPLHFRGEVCFVVSMIVFYIVSKSLPFSAFTVLMPLFWGISTALICNMIKEIIDDENKIKKQSLRDAIKEKLNNDTSRENIYNCCIEKGYTENKAKDITDTVYTYLTHTQYETAQIVHCDNRTVTRRIKEFLKD